MARRPGEIIVLLETWVISSSSSSSVLLRSSMFGEPGLVVTLELVRWCSYCGAQFHVLFIKGFRLSFSAINIIIIFFTKFNWYAKECWHKPRLMRPAEPGQAGQFLSSAFGTFSPPSGGHGGRGENEVQHCEQRFPSHFQSVETDNRPGQARQFLFCSHCRPHLPTTLPNRPVMYIFTYTFKKIYFLSQIPNWFKCHF